MNLHAILQQRLQGISGKNTNLQIQAVRGGSINEAYRVQWGVKAFFCKINSASKFPHLFQKESAGLQFLAAQNRIQTPAVIDCFEAAGKQALLLEWVPEGDRTEAFWKTFGEQLAALHRVSNEQHGWQEDNYMGSVPQSNTPRNNWVAFFAQERLTPLLHKCSQKNLLDAKDNKQFEQLMQKLPDIFAEEKPSLLHGDLWSGNFLCNQHAEPVLIDPAVYYGHRSMDLAMTTLFGGFRRPFYEAYDYHFPFPFNYKEQWAVCNLYPLLIHLFLFGTGYLAQIKSTLQQFT